MKLLVSERDAFANCIYQYLINFVGNGIFYLECWGENLISILLRKKPKLSMLLNSTRHVFSVLHALLHVITKKMHEEDVINIPISQMRKLRYRDVTVVTSQGNTCFFLSAFIYLLNCVGKGIVWLECWGKNPISIFCIKKKLSELLRSSKQCSGSFARSSSFNQKENRRVKCYQHSHFIFEEIEAQRL